MLRSLLLGGFFVAVSATVISWLLTGESSPFAEYFLYHPSLPNFWALINFPSYLAGAMAGSGLHSVNLYVARTVFFIQWFLVGVFLTLIGSLISRKK